MNIYKYELNTAAAFSPSHPPPSPSPAFPELRGRGGPKKKAGKNQPPAPPPPHT
eukprot:COSAG02_NODE_38399_length_429_cov_1.084848_1_plen_53_part_10